MELGQRIKQARLEAGLSQRQLCGQEITRNMLSQIENGAARPSMATLQYLAARLGRSVSFFLEETSASPNQTRMDAARNAFRSQDYRRVLAALAEYTGPDPVFDAEKNLLETLSCIFLAEASPDVTLLEQAAAAGGRTPYYTPELERRRLLCLSRTENADLPAIAAAIPAPDQELLLAARAALMAGDHHRCAAFLDAVREQTTQWLLLRADCAYASGDYAAAIEYYTRSGEAYAQLEQCYLKLEDYKMAYHYACLQR